MHNVFPCIQYKKWLNTLLYYYLSGSNMMRSFGHAHLPAMLWSLPICHVLVVMHICLPQSAICIVPVWLPSYMSCCCRHAQFHLACHIFTYSYLLFMLLFATLWLALWIDTHCFLASLFACRIQKLLFVGMHLLTVTFLLALFLAGPLLAIVNKLLFVWHAASDCHIFTCIVFGRPFACHS